MNGDRELGFPDTHWLMEHMLVPEVAMVAVSTALMPDGIQSFHTFVFVLPAGPFDTDETAADPYHPDSCRAIAFTVPRTAGIKLAESIMHVERTGDRPDVISHWFDGSPRPMEGDS